MIESELKKLLDTLEQIQKNNRKMGGKSWSVKRIFSVCIGCFCSQ